MACKGCEKRRQILKGWKEKAIESYRKLASRNGVHDERDAGTELSTDQPGQPAIGTEHSTDQPGQPAIGTDTTTANGADAGGG